MNHRIASAVAAVLAASPASGVWAQDAETVGLQEIIVTAQRRAESLQDVPIAVQALTGDTLAQLNVSTLDDYVRFLPSVSTANFGPGQSNVYMRGLATGALGTQGTGTNGPWPNVAIYLDEQSTLSPGRNLDVYAADLERIEVLTGPQGTLFGAGAQAGVLRYITNKPVLNETSTQLKAGYSNTSDGDDGYNIEAVINLPIGDRLAARVVAYQELRGGYIDNVFSTFTRRGTDLGFALRNGGVVPANSVVIDNADIVDKNINEVEYQGARGSLKWQINDDWDALLAVAYQKIDSEGVFYQLPVGSEGQDLDDLEVTLFNEGFTEDEFVNTALTVTGKVGAFDLVYAGAYLSRDSETANDYTNYARGVWGTYYQCTGYSLGFAPPDQCFSPSSFWNDKSDSTNQSHEIRLSSPDDWRFRFIGGLFYEKRELEANTDWFYKSVPECPDSGVSVGDCFLHLDPAAAPAFASATFNDPTRRDPNVGFFNDFTREYTQTAAFLSVDFDILENLTLTLGTRYFDIENSFRGAFLGSFYCKTFGNGQSGPCTTPFGTNVDERPDNDNQEDGFRSRANISWQATDDVMLYATWSESFRPGGFNRTSACGVRDPANNIPQWCMPTSYESDDLTNIEIGWKTVFANNRVQFNGAIYQVTWDNVQSGLFAPQLGFPNLQFFVNGPEYEVNGVEVNLMFAPTDGLTIAAAASYNDTELKNSPQFVNNNPDSPTFGETITESCLAFDAGTGTCTNVVSVEDVFGTPGTPLAFAPEFQGNVRARYEWNVGDYTPYVGAAVQYQDSSFSSAAVVNRNVQPSWTTADASVGFLKRNWGAELYVTNLTDENKSLYSTSAQFILAEVPMRPRTLGLRFTYNFDQN